MKNITLTLFVLILLTTCTYSLKLKADKITWSKSTITYTDKQVTFYYSSNITKDLATSALTLVLKTNDKIDFYGPQDFYVVTLTSVYYFAATDFSDKRVLKTGGGALIGIWELIKSADGKNLILRPEQNGSILKKEGLSIVGSYSVKSDDKDNANVNFSLKNVIGAKETANSGKGSDANEPYPDNGLKLEFIGSITNETPLNKNGKASVPTDINPAAGSDVGSAGYTLVYFISAISPEFQVYFNIAVASGKMPIKQLGFELAYDKKIPSGYEVVSAPELMLGNQSTNLSNVEVNKYFTNSCVAELLTYDMSNSKDFSVFTPPGRGQVSCIGSPKKKQVFFCIYPNNDNLPREAFETYKISISEDSANSVSFFRYSLLDNIPIIVEANTKLTISARIKYIDASPSLFNPDS